MDTMKILWNAARIGEKRALPVLSFPAAQKLGATVRELVHSAELQAQAMAYVAHNTPTVAAVSLMDLSVEAEAFGAAVRFADNEVPAVTGKLVGDIEGAEALDVPPLSSGRPLLCVEAVRRAKELVPDKPVIAGVIGPFSLAGRLMDVTEIMYACYDEPEVVNMVVDKAARFIAEYCRAFKEAGADGVLIAEPLAGLLRADMAAEFSCPAVTRIIEAVRSEDFPVLYHNCGNAAAQMLPELYAMKADAYHFGNAVSMAEVLKNAPADMLCMGNISPANQFAQGTVESIRKATRELMETCGNYPNFVPSSGCDIPAHSSWDNIHAFFEAVEG
ncbi:MAG: methyltransferase [Clostridiales bacterium]|nr:methyltransferase [Clostridiales bacterium]